MDYVFELTNSLRTGDREFRGFSASWRAVPNPLASPPGTRRGTSWGATFMFRMDPMKRGVRVEYGYSGLPDEWPFPLAAKLWDPRTAAEILAALEREARKRSV